MGTMTLVTRVAEAHIDPMIATLADRTHPRWGHFRPCLVWMAVPMAVPMALSAVLTFTTLRFEGAARTVDGIRLLMSLVPAVGAVMAVVVLWFCRLDEATALRMGRAPTLRRGDAAV